MSFFQPMSNLAAALASHLPGGSQDRFDSRLRDLERTVVFPTRHNSLLPSPEEVLADLEKDVRAGVDVLGPLPDTTIEPPRTIDQPPRWTTAFFETSSTEAQPGHDDAIRQRVQALLIVEALRQGLDVHAMIPYAKPPSFTPLAGAVHHRSMVAARMFLAHGADATRPIVSTSTDPHQASDVPLTWTVLHVLSQHNRRAADLESAAWIDLLLQHGADLEARDSMGRTPLHAAVLNGNLHVVSAFLNAGADPNLRIGLDARQSRDLFRRMEAIEPDTSFSVSYAWLRGRGTTSLHWATHLLNANLIDLLLKAGADPLALDADGRTPMDTLNGPPPFQDLVDSCRRLLEKAMLHASSEAMSLEPRSRSPRL